MKKYVYLILTIIWISFIFYNSLQNAQLSTLDSGRVVNLFKEILNTLNIYINQKLLYTLVRKGAHIFEFFILSILVYNSYKSFIIKIKYYIVFSFCIMIAIIDELLQKFSFGRSSSIIDVLIDGIGVSVGIILIVIIKFILYKKKNKTMLNIR